MALALLKIDWANLVRSDSRLVKASERKLLESLVDCQEEGKQLLKTHLQELEGQFEQMRQAEVERLQAYAKEEGAKQLVALSEQMRAYQIAIEEQFVTTVLEAVRALVGYPLPPSYFDQALNAAGALVGSATRAELKVAVDDMPAAKASLERYHEANKKMLIELLVEETFASGRCELRTPFGRVELSLDAQLATLEASLNQWAGEL
jgi:flagellar biosynthesis/type III secretory pathway protein FliH